MQKVAAVVVTYNRKKLLCECLERLMKQEYPCDILVIDNASTDGTKESIDNFIQTGKIQYYNTGSNLGGAGGFNFGMRLAVENGYEYVWIMDDDTYAEADALYQLMEADQKLQGNYGFLSGVAYWTDGTLCNMNRQRISLRKKAEDFSSAVSPIIMATFVSFFVKSSVIREMGLPIKEFFIWADDLEYSRRISKKYPCYLVPDSKVIHCMGSNQKVGIEQESKDRLWRYQYLYRNEVYVFRREGLKGWFYLFARVGCHVAKILIKAKSDRTEKLKTIISSFISGFKFYPAIEYVDKES